MRIKHQIQNRQMVTPTATALARVLNFILFLSTSLKRQFACNRYHVNLSSE